MIVSIGSRTNASTFDKLVDGSKPSFRSPWIQAAKHFLRGMSELFIIEKNYGHTQIQAKWNNSNEDLANYRKTNKWSSSNNECIASILWSKTSHKDSAFQAPKGESKKKETYFYTSQLKLFMIKHAATQHSQPSSTCRMAWTMRIEGWGIFRV